MPGLNQKRLIKKARKLFPGLYDPVESKSGFKLNLKDRNKPYKYIYVFFRAKLNTIRLFDDYGECLGYDDNGFEFGSIDTKDNVIEMIKKLI